jgi:hypothetical protein
MEVMEGMALLSRLVTDRSGIRVISYMNFDNHIGPVMQIKPLLQNRTRRRFSGTKKPRPQWPGPADASMASAT